MNDINHAQAQQWSSAGRQHLAGGEQAALDAHLAGCAECREHAARLLALDARLAGSMQALRRQARPPANMQAAVVVARAGRGRQAWRAVQTSVAAAGILALALAVWLVAPAIGRLAAPGNETAVPGVVSPAVEVTVLPTGGPGTEAPSTGLPPTLSAAAWQGTERVTVLVMGIDRRPEQPAERGYLTDSLMLVSVDPASRTAAMLSIPRDLWVEIPGFGQDTINTANRTGDYNDYPGGGPALAVETVEYNLGVSIDYYLRLDFAGFETFIDNIGGVQIVNETAIDDPTFPDGAYGYDPFTLAAGAHTLNGRDALRYARTRHGDSDLQRAGRQQQVALAVRDQLLSPGALPGLIARAPMLFQSLSGSVQTDLSLEQMASLALLAPDIPRDNIRSAVLDFDYVVEYTTPEGRMVLVPLRDEVRLLREELFGAGRGQAGSPPATPAPLPDASLANCPVSLPNLTETPDPYYISQTSGYGNPEQTMFISLWPEGRVIFYPGGPGELARDGSLTMKFWFYRTVPGEVVIEGQRLDEPSEPALLATLRGPDDGYGETGFHPAGLRFPGQGCWQVTASAGDQRLVFVTAVQWLAEAPGQ